MAISRSPFGDCLPGRCESSTMCRGCFRSARIILATLLRRCMDRGSHKAHEGVANLVSRKLEVNRSVLQLCKFFGKAPNSPQSLQYTVANSSGNTIYRDRRCGVRPLRAFRAGVGPKMGYPSPLGTWRPFVVRYRCRPGAGFRQSCRRTAPSTAVRRRSVP